MLLIQFEICIYFFKIVVCFVYLFINFFTILTLILNVC